MPLKEQAAILLLGLILLETKQMAQEKPPLPGPGLELPVDLNGDGIASFGDLYAFNYWLECGGDLGAVLVSARISGEVIDLSDFFSSPAMQISPSVSAPSNSEPDSVLFGPTGGIDFTRRIPPSVIRPPSRFGRRPMASISSSAAWATSALAGQWVFPRSIGSRLRRTI